MSYISCECAQEDGHPCPGFGGDYVCPHSPRNQSTPNVSSFSSCSSGVDGDCELSGSSTDTLEEPSVRVINLCRLFEEKIRSLEKLTAPVSRRDSKASKVSKESGESIGIEPNKSDATLVPPTEQASAEQNMGEDEEQEEDPRYFKSHTKIVSIPNGVKIITTIFSDDQTVRLSDEQSAVYETLIYPESEIINRFQQEVSLKMEQDQRLVVCQKLKSDSIENREVTV
ncbi:uncharacterized protein LOC129756344 [Uranotaenia lowii]|uniref:uncharacterized protein LOC129756344 n=1 Tax=Uranotaenia lowii TaxID=190385 RepID=UPI002479B826|nr:uncharacterized protein LOC129756344 [Uranotaenia lowii]